MTTRERPKSTLRYELKYLVRQTQWPSLIRELSQQLTLDEHGDARGRYPITSLYYDTADYRAYWDKLEGHRHRRKVRVRIYGDTQVRPDTRCFVEVKERRNTRVSKRRARLPYASAEKLAQYARVADTHEGDAPVLREIYYLYQTLHLQPACIVRYDRMAFEGNENYPDLRVTLDTNLRGRVHDLTLQSTGTASEHFVLPPEVAILEVKVNQSVPYWLTQLLRTHACTFYRISKYCAALERCGVIAARQRVVVRSALVADIADR